MKTTYWDRRALKRLDDAEKMSEEYIKRVKKIYKKAFKDIEKDINNVYKNYSKDTGLDVQRLKELLTRSETKKLWEQMKRQGLNEYIKDNYKARISRLEQIQAQIYAKAKQIYPKEELEHTMAYKGVINDSYYKAVYDTQMGTGFNFSFSKIDDNLMTALLSERWSGKNYSERIWGNTDILANSLSEVISSGMMSGQSNAKMIKQIRERFDVGQYYAERLVRTETNHFNNMADAMAYEEMGVEKYVFVATLDERTSEKCQNMDGKKFAYKDKQEGVNYPPLHPNCRSKTRGYVSDEVEKSLQRRAKNPITGQTEVINNMSYKQWMKKHGVIDNKNGMFRTKDNIVYNTKTLNKLDNKLVQTNSTQLNKLMNKYPTISKYIKERGLTYGGSTKTDAIAYTSYTRDMKNLGIYLENNYYKDPKVYRKTIKTGVKEKKFMPCSDKFIDTYAITHEYGHVVETFLLNKYNINNPVEYKEALTSQYQWAKYKDKVYNDIRKDIIDIALKHNSNFNIEEQLSKYGKSSPAEFFAECFANAECGKPNELGKAIREYLKGVL